MPLIRDVKDQLGSSYLISHADNPVDGWLWGEDALDEARRLDRPIFLSVGYAACHWCHVMAHESFEDPVVGAQLNSSFIAIKVDREERPDVDALYMAATQLVSGHGGWPMSVFLLPDGRPFMAGTYYPPVDRHGQVGFARLLDAMTGAWTMQRDAVIAQASELNDSLAREVNFIDHLAPFNEALDLTAAQRALRDELVARVDADGGFSDAPKFPRPSYVDALLAFDDEEARNCVTRTLDAMARGGLYDHLRGGFARYSVDAQWHVPHFEKMLSDQALLARTYLHAATLVDGRAWWRDVALDTMHFVMNDLQLDRGFAASLDADAGGVEGSHVTWTNDEVRAALNRDGQSQHLGEVIARWRIETPGAFERRSIPRLDMAEPFTTPPRLEGALASLRRARAARVQPARDEKVILEWNAMFATALLRSGDEELITRGLELLTSLSVSHFHDGMWWRTATRRAHATAADVAWMIDALLDAFEVEGHDAWLTDAADLSTYLLRHYWDGVVPNVRSPLEGHGLFALSDLVTDLSTRPKEIFDGATPSSHAVACRALARVALCRGDADVLAVAQRLVELAAALVASHPGAVPDLVAAAGFALDGVEIVVPGRMNDLSRHVRSRAMTRSVLITGSGSSPLLDHRVEGLAYVCRSGNCQLPVSSVRDLDEQLARVGL